MIRTGESRRGRQPRAGFTLVEILATLMLVAIILPAAMKGISLATTVAGLAKQRVEAASLAESKMTELLAGAAWQESDLEGDFSPDWPDYRWDAEVKDWEGLALQQLDVRVEWTLRNQDYSLVISTLIYTGEE